MNRPPSDPTADRSADLESLRAERDRLAELAARLEYERDGYYGEWQSAKNELRRFRWSPAWPVWLAWLLVWKVLLWPVRKGLKLAGAGLRALPRLVAAPYLLIEVTLIRLRARWTRPPSAIPEPAAQPGGSARSVPPPRVLIVMPYSIFPPHHGGAVRLYNLVRSIGARCDLHLLIFSRAGEDPVQRAALEPHCARVDFHRWVPSIERDRWGLQPPNALLFASRQAAAKIRDLVIGHHIDVVQLEYTELGQYLGELPPGVPSILTEHDIAFQSLARRRRLRFARRFPEGRAFGTSGGDWRRLVRYEIAANRRASQVHTMSVDDARHLARFLPDGATRLRVVPNGVDCAYYAPPPDNPPREGVLYVGNFENLPNVDAIEHLALDIWPLIRSRVPDARLDVVGANATDRVRRFGGTDGIAVLGEVSDLRAAYHRHRVMVAPIRAGSGTRLKILEAFAAGIPVVSTTLGAEGLPAEHGTHLLLADSADAFAEAVERVLGDERLAESLARNAGRLAQTRYDWALVADRLMACYEELLADLHPRRRERPQEVIDILEPSDPDAVATHPTISIIIPTRNGGEPLRQSLAAVAGQQEAPPHELVCIDSGSSVDELRTMQELGARVLRIDPHRDNDGLTRDLAARHARGSILVFLHQDTIPADRRWLSRLVAPLLDGDAAPAAVQGAILDRPPNGRPFFWASSDETLRFTREARRWLEAHDGIRLSTANCAVRRSVWKRHHFGWAVAEGAKWQREIVGMGHSVVSVPEAAAHQDRLRGGVRSLARGCLAEGAGWRSLGVDYSLGDALRDVLQPAMAASLLRGLLRGRVGSAAEITYPWLRPLALWWGNRVTGRAAL